MRTFIAIVAVCIGGLAAADERPRLTDREAPRATDLLRAETLARRARERLETPAPRSSGWKHGGTGWDAHEAPPASPRAPGSVTVHVGTVRKPRTTVE